MVQVSAAFSVPEKRKHTHARTQARTHQYFYETRRRNCTHTHTHDTHARSRMHTHTSTHVHTHTHTKIDIKQGGEIGCICCSLATGEKDERGGQKELALGSSTTSCSPAKRTGPSGREAKQLEDETDMTELREE